MKAIENLKNGMTVITNTPSEEMELINELVDAGMGSDIKKTYISDGVFSWVLKSSISSIESSIEELKSNSIEVHSFEDHSLGFANIGYFVKKSDVECLDLNIKFHANKLTSNGVTMDILEIIP